MASRFKKATPLGRHHMAAWREHRKITREKMAELLSQPHVGSGMTRESLFRVETFKVPYGQDLLEAYSELLGCGVADLLTRRPNDKETILSAWDSVREDQKDQVLAVVRTFGRPDATETGDNN